MPLLLFSKAIRKVIIKQTVKKIVPSTFSIFLSLAWMDIRARLVSLFGRTRFTFISLKIMNDFMTNERCTKKVVQIFCNYCFSQLNQVKSVAFSRKTIFYSNYKKKLGSQLKVYCILTWENLLRLREHFETKRCPELYCKGLAKHFHNEAEIKTILTFRNQSSKSAPRSSES